MECHGSIQLHAYTCYIYRTHESSSTRTNNQLLNSCLLQVLLSNISEIQVHDSPVRQRRLARTFEYWSSVYLAVTLQSLLALGLQSENMFHPIHYAGVYRCILRVVPARSLVGRRILVHNWSHARHTHIYTADARDTQLAYKFKYLPRQTAFLHHRHAAMHM
jgi:hypothetical protein